MVIRPYVLALGVVAWVSVLSPAGATAQSASSPAGDLAPRGRYLVTLMGCSDCHTDGALAGKPDNSRYLAGSTIGFEVPGIGVVYGKNLTPDPETGLGKWTDDEVVRALKRGQSRDGRPLAPIMPWPVYGTLTEDDTRAIVAFLRSLTPVRFAPPANAKPGDKAPSPYMTIVEPK